MILECCNARIMAGLSKGMEAVLLFHKLHLKVLRPRPGSLPGHVLLHTQATHSSIPPLTVWLAIVQTIGTLLTTLWL